MVRQKKPNINRRKHDIAQEQQAKSDKRKTRLVIALKIFAYGLLAVLIFPYLKESSLFNNQTPASAKIESYQEPEIEYNFYSLLPGEKVVEPPVAFSHTKQEDLSQVKSYMLQVASFKTMRRAQKLKQVLTRYKFTSITLDKIKNKQATWYRVSLGPFANIKLAQESRANLSLKGIHNSVIKTWNIR